MRRVFVEMPEFQKAWHSLNLNEDDLNDLQIFLTNNPDFGDVISGTGGLRKIRWAAKGKGKRSGARVLYVDLVVIEKIYFISAYSKNEKVNISVKDKNKIKELISILKHEGK